MNTQLSVSTLWMTFGGAAFAFGVLVGMPATMIFIPGSMGGYLFGLVGLATIGAMVLAVPIWRLSTRQGLTRYRGTTAGALIGLFAHPFMWVSVLGLELSFGDEITPGEWGAMVISYSLYSLGLTGCLSIPVGGLVGRWLTGKTLSEPVDG